MKLISRASVFALALNSTVPWTARLAWSQTTPVTCCTKVSTVLKKTMLKVSVAHLEVDVDSATAAKVQSAIGDAQTASREISNAIAEAYMAATHADATVEFLRSLTADQFIGGQKDSFRRMVKSGLLTDSAASQMEQDTEQQLAFLADGGIHNGDKLVMSLRGDTVSTQFVTAGGFQRANFDRVGPERRIAFLGQYFGPGADFRRGLIESALRSAATDRDWSGRRASPTCTPAGCSSRRRMNGQSRSGRAPDR